MHGGVLASIETCHARSDKQPDNTSITPVAVQSFGRCGAACGRVGRSRFCFFTLLGFDAFDQLADGPFQALTGRLNDPRIFQPRLGRKGKVGISQELRKTQYGGKLCPHLEAARDIAGRVHDSHP